MPHPSHTWQRIHALSSSAKETDLTPLWGYVILVAVSIFFVLCMYMLVFSKLLPETGVELLDWIKHDRYYCYLAPATVPVTVGFIYFNWLSLKFFRHN
mmetsp:Transcript_26044/g.65443  ORF Transcript_26044/g.65443 Transcript_26044/m.65443 type:complete len:98 (-) Transcript_26044:958-1251(-)